MNLSEYICFAGDSVGDAVFAISSKSLSPSFFMTLAFCHSQLIDFYYKYSHVHGLYIQLFQDFWMCLDVSGLLHFLTEQSSNQEVYHFAAGSFRSHILYAVYGSQPTVFQNVNSSLLKQSILSFICLNCIIFMIFWYFKDPD